MWEYVFCQDHISIKCDDGAVCICSEAQVEALRMGCFSGLALEMPLCAS